MQKKGLTIIKTNNEDELTRMDKDKYVSQSQHVLVRATFFSFSRPSRFLILVLGISSFSGVYFEGQKLF